MRTKKQPRHLNDKRYEQFLRELNPIYVSLTNVVSEFNPAAFDEVRAHKTESLRNVVSASYKLERVEG